MVTPDLWGMGGLGSGPRCGIDGLGQYKTPDMLEPVRDGLWRPGEAFYQIGLSDESSPVTTQKGSAHSCSDFGGKIQNGVPTS